MGKDKQLQEKKRGIKRSTLTGRIVNGRDIILCEEAVIYLKKMGYKVISPSIIAGIYTLTFLFLFLGVITLVNAPPFSTNIYFENGLTIINDPREIIQQNKDFQINFFVYNQSNGDLLDNTTIECKLFLSKDDGQVIYSSDVNYYSDGHWGEDILGGNFSRSGIYTYGIQCQGLTSDIGGALSGQLEVVKTGLFAVQDKSLFYIVIGFLLIISIGSIMLKYYPLASLSMLVNGFVLLFNEVNLIISVIVIVTGILLAFVGKD